MPAFCAVINCSNRSERDRKSFFRFPAIPQRIGEQRKQLCFKRRNKWLMALKRSDVTDEKIKHFRICSDHFISGKPANLYDVTNSDWVPSLNMGYMKTESCLSTEENYSNDEHRACMSKKRPLIIEEISISTSYPENIALLFPQRDLQQQKSFQEPKLLSTDNIHVAVNPVIHSRTSKINVVINKSAINVKPAVSNSITENESCRTFTFKNLAKNLSLIKRPNEFWGISKHSSFIVCARWSSDYTCEKRIVIDDSLTIRIFLKNWEAVNLSELIKIASLDEISNLLVKVESYKIIKVQD